MSASLAISTCSSRARRVRPLAVQRVGRLRLRRQRQHDDGDVVDAAADDQRLGDADRDAVHVGADLFVDAQDRGVGAGADDEARGDHRAVVRGLRIDVLDAVDALDDRLQRLGDELDRVLGLQAVGAHVDVHHRHGNLRLLLARQRDQRDEAEREGRQQEQRRQRRGDEIRVSRPAMPSFMVSRPCRRREGRSGFRRARPPRFQILLR